MVKSIKNKITVFGVEIDEVTEDQVIDQIDQWLKGKTKQSFSASKHYVVTPNIEFLMAAKKDPEFKKILNNADLKIPDSARFNWIKSMGESTALKRLLVWPFFFFPSVKTLPSFPVTTGADIMSRLIEESGEKGYRIGLIGGRAGLAEKVRQRYLAGDKTSGIVFTDSSIKVDSDGNTINSKYEVRSNTPNFLGKLAKQIQNSNIKSQNVSDFGFRNSDFPELDILFVGLGQVKQEKWIHKNLDKLPVKIMMGVGGSIDYLSGDIARAPLFMRRLGLEWLFRLILQPWRIKRFGKLVEFVFIMLAISDEQVPASQ